MGGTWPPFGDDEEKGAGIGFCVPSEGGDSLLLFAFVLV